MKALIVDDEIRAIRNLENIIMTGHPDAFSAIETASTMEAAILQLNTNPPDVVFLDIHLRDATGFDVLNKVDRQPFQVIFVTAYDEYAIKAIRLNAFDYLLKPIDVNELDDCVFRLAVCFKQKEGVALPALAPLPVKVNPDYIMLKDAFNYERLPFTSIYYLEASGPYTNIIYEKNGKQVKITKSKSLYEFEQLLPVQDFIRIHRSYVINIRNAGKLVKQKEKFFVQIGTEVLPVSRRRFLLLADLLDASTS